MDRGPTRGLRQARSDCRILERKMGGIVTGAMYGGRKWKDIRHQSCPSLRAASATAQASQDVMASRKIGGSPLDNQSMEECGGAK